MDADAAIRPGGLIVRVPEDPVRVTGQAALELPTAGGAWAKRYPTDETDGHCGFPEAHPDPGQVGRKLRAPHAERERKTRPFRQLLRAPCDPRQI